MVAHQADSIIKGDARGMQPMGYFAGGPQAISLLRVANAPFMLREPNYTAIMVVTQGYLIQLIGTIVSAYASQWISRKNLIQWALLGASISTLLALVVAEGGLFLLCG